MFGKKKRKKEKAEELHVEVQTMPGIFYGGNDPEIYHSKDVPANDPNVISSKPQKRKISKTSSEHPKRKKIVIIVGIVVFIIVVAGISWYYIAQFNNATNRTTPVNVNTPTTPTEIIVPTTTESDVIETTTTTATSTVEVPVSLTVEVDINFPAIVQSDTVDIDSDQLTDKEEELYGTDSGGFDTDGDGYFDGQEVFNLYNPGGSAPSRLIDSGRVVEYINPLSGYRLYYPLTWQVGNVDTLGNHVLFSSVEGDFIEVRTYDKNPTESFNEWFGKAIKGQRITDILQFENRFKIKAWKRRDDLVAYFIEDSRVHVVVFNPRELGPISHRHVMKMLVQSFRYSSTTETLPDQIIIPGTTSVTPEVTTDTTTTTE